MKNRAGRSESGVLRTVNDIGWENEGIYRWGDVHGGRLEAKRKEE